MSTLHLCIYYEGAANKLTSHSFAVACITTGAGEDRAHPPSKHHFVAETRMYFNILAGTGEKKSGGENLNIPTAVEFHFRKINYKTTQKKEEMC